MSVDNPELDQIDEILINYTSFILDYNDEVSEINLRGVAKKIILKHIEDNYIHKAQASKDMAAVIGEIEWEELVGTNADMRRKGRNQLRAEQRKTAASKGYKVEGE